MSPRATVLALLLAVACTANAADTAVPAAADPALEKRVMALSAELRCLVCQNQSLADSHADLAVDLRNQVRDMLASGKSEAEVKAFMTERYGDFVLYRPPVKATTVLLWVGPFVLRLAAVAGLFVYLARRRRAVAEVPEALSGEDAERARRLLEEG
jgi:cytochrome c-type biogenesis protein CcmH